jgi:hypothetical protein
MSGHAIGLAGDTTIVDWLQLSRAEYAEVPGLHLTKPQAQDLWSLDPWVCDALLNALVDAGFLRRTSADAYVRVHSSGGAASSRTRRMGRAWRQSDGKQDRSARVVPKISVEAGRGRAEAEKERF